MPEARKIYGLTNIVDVSISDLVKTGWHQCSCFSFCLSVSVSLCVCRRLLFVCVCMCGWFWFPAITACCCYGPQKPLSPFRASVFLAQANGLDATDRLLGWTAPVRMQSSPQRLESPASPQLTFTHAPQWIDGPSFKGEEKKKQEKKNKHIYPSFDGTHCPQ